jgi:hypothetical protein
MAKKILIEFNFNRVSNIGMNDQGVKKFGALAF